MKYCLAPKHHKPLKTTAAARAVATAWTAGFDYDAINAEALLTRISARNGRLTLPDGMSCRYLVLPHQPDEPDAILSHAGLRRKAVKMAVCAQVDSGINEAFVTATSCTTSTTLR